MSLFKALKVTINQLEKITTVETDVSMCAGSFRETRLSGTDTEGEHVA